MSNSKPSAIVLHGIPCIGGLYISFDSNGEIGSLKVRRNSPFERPHRLSLAKLSVLVEPVEGNFCILADLDEVAVWIMHVAAPFPSVIV
jgi:hypothetical protein